MKENNYTEVFGGLEKLEDFSTIRDNIVQGTLVFESVSPFLGYYNDALQDSSPVYIYFAVDKTYPVFEVIRAFHNIKTETGLNFDAAKAFAKFNDRNYNIIRLRHFDGFDKIKIIQEAFNNNGIKLLHSSVSWKKITAHVTLNKIFCIQRLRDGINLDACEENHAYIEIPRHLDFEEFTRITHIVKNNWFENKFDAALGYYLLEERVIDFIRVYSKQQDLQYLLDIRKLYLDKIK
jgi:hypothetical protein